jgi:hypothetical protein
MEETPIAQQETIPYLFGKHDKVTDKRFGNGEVRTVITNPVVYPVMVHFDNGDRSCYTADGRPAVGWDIELFLDTETDPTDMSFKHTLI